MLCIGIGTTVSNKPHIKFKINRVDLVTMFIMKLINKKNPPLCSIYTRK